MQLKNLKICDVHRERGKKMKKIGALLLSLVFMLNSFCFAEEAVILTEDTNKVTMTLDEAVEFALTNNPSLVDANFKKMQKDQEEIYDDARTTYRIWQDKVKSGGYSFEDPTEYLTCWGYSLEMAELAYKSFLATRESTEETIAYTVKKIAYSLDELEKSVELLEKTVLKQEMDVKIAEVKSSLNMITVLDVEAANQTLTSTKLQLESLKSTLGSVKTSLKSLMGVDVTKELIITIPENEFNILEVEDIAKVIEDSLETNGEVINAKISYKQKEMNNIIATKTQFLDREGIKDAKRAFSDAESRLNNSINVVKENLLSLYNLVKTNEESTILAKSEYEQLQTKYRQMEVMYELGMITKHDFNSYEIALINSKNTYEAALHENILLKERWNIALKVGDVLAKEAQGNEG